MKRNSDCLRALMWITPWICTGNDHLAKPSKYFEQQWEFRPQHIFGHSLISLHWAGEARSPSCAFDGRGYTVRVGPSCGGQRLVFFRKFRNWKVPCWTGAYHVWKTTTTTCIYIQYMQVVFFLQVRHNVIQWFSSFVHKILKMLFRVANEVSSLFRHTYINGIKWHQTVTLLTFLHFCTAKGYPRQCSKWSPIWCLLVPEGDVTSVAGNVGAHLHRAPSTAPDTPRSVNSASAVSWHEGNAHYSQVSSKFVQDLKSWRSCAKRTGTGLKGRFCKVRILPSTTTPKCCLADVLQLDQGSGIARTGQSQRVVLWMLIWMLIACSIHGKIMQSRLRDHGLLE